MCSCIINFKTSLHKPQSYLAIWYDISALNILLFINKYTEFSTTKNYIMLNNVKKIVYQVYSPVYSVIYSVS